MSKHYLLVLLLALIGLSRISTAQTVDQNYIDGQIYFAVSHDLYSKMVKTHGTTLNQVEYFDFLNNLQSQFGITGVKQPFSNLKVEKIQRILKVYFSDINKVDQFLSALKQVSGVYNVERVPLYKSFATPNDPYYGTVSGIDWNWHLDVINASGAWDIAYGNNSVAVGVVDNAILETHADLAAAITASYDGESQTTGSSAPPSNTYEWSHGTHCAGLIGAVTNNSVGVASMGSGVNIYSAKGGRDSDGQLYYLAEGLNWIINQPIKVLSMSFGGYSSSQNEQDFYTQLHDDLDIVLLAAAANDGVTDMAYPAAYDNIIAVASTDQDNGRSSFSNYGSWVDIAAPGGSSDQGVPLLSTTACNATDASAGIAPSDYGISGQYNIMSGTSMATPLAAGLVGLMRSHNPALTADQIEQCLFNSCVNVGTFVEHGRIDAAAAMACVHATLTGDPVANFTSNVTSLVVDGQVTFTDASSDGGNPITSWEWTFNGGSPASYTGQTPPAITYSSVGTYGVSLTVTNSNSSDVETKVGYIVVTEEALGAWTPQATGFATASRGINHISIVDANIAWAVAYDGTNTANNIREFTKTINGGTTWTAGSMNLGSTTLAISMLDAIDANNAYVAVYPTSTTKGGIWKTVNGGSNWTKQTTASFNNASSFANVVYFFDANNGVCMGDPINSEFEIYTTTNGGTTWTLVSGANIPAPLTGEYGYAGQFEAIGDNFWFTTNKGRIYYSSDKGFNYQVFQSPISDFGSGTTSGDISFKNATTGMLVASTGTVYKTTNSGANWVTITPVGTVFKGGGLCWVAGADVIFSTSAASGTAGSSYSEDAGATWVTIDDEQHLDVDFINVNTGWSGWFNTDAVTNGIWKWEPTNVSVKPVIANNSVLIFPNPATDYITIKGSDLQSVRIIDLNGKVIKSVTLNQNEQNIDISSLQKGIYVVNLVEKGKVSVYKLIKM